MLFPNFDRTNTAPKKPRESIYNFLNNSAWQLCELIREYFNDWGKDFESDIEFVKRFQSKTYKQHKSASFELLIYIIFKKHKFSILKHPFTGTSRRLDFSIITQSGFEIMIECTLSGHSYESQEELNLKEIIEAIIEEKEYYPFLINIGFNKLSDISISKKDLWYFIDSFKNQNETLSNDQLAEKRAIFIKNGWEIEFSLLRKPEPSSKRNIGFKFGNAKVIESSKAILIALKDKIPSNYGIVNQPFVICLDVDDLSVDDNSISEALFGQYTSDGINLNLSKSAFFFHNNKELNTSVSGIIVFKSFDTFKLTASSITFWHNPFARNPIPRNTFPFNEYIFQQSNCTLKREAVIKYENVFNLLGINQPQYNAALNKR